MAPDVAIHIFHGKQGFKSLGLISASNIQKTKVSGGPFKPVPKSGVSQEFLKFSDNKMGKTKDINTSPFVLNQ